MTKIGEIRRDISIGEAPCDHEWIPSCWFHEVYSCDGDKYVILTEVICNKCLTQKKLPEEAQNGNNDLRRSDQENEQDDS